MDRETIQRARQADLSQYLMSIGVPLIRNGIRWKHKEHDSLTFTENAYYWNSRQEHGNAVDYLTKYMDMSFQDAVTALIGFSSVDREPVLTKDFELGKMELSRSIDRVKRYLNKSRFVGYNVVDYLIENKLLCQEVKTNNALFLMYDENHNCVGAEAQGITLTRFKQIKAGSKYGYGFNVPFSDNGSFDFALFFESAIDLISFIDHKMNCKKKSLKRCLLVSMAGLKVNILKHTLKAFKGPLRPVICVDNDKAGAAFTKNLKEENIAFILRQPDERYKDWNEQVTAEKKDNKAILRLIEKEKIGREKS